MTGTEFVDRFGHLDDMQFWQLPDEQFLAMCQETNEQLSGYVMELFSRERFLETATQRYRLVNILRRLLACEGRGFWQLMLVSAIAAELPELYDLQGVGALAGISCHLNNCDLSEIPEQLKRSLLNEFRRFATVPSIAHNARSCAQVLQAALPPELS